MISAVNINGGFYKNWSLVSDIVIVNFLWLAVTLIGCGITFGAATTAAYTITNKIVDKKNYSVFKDFFLAFKNNFKTSTIVWLILALLGVLCFYNYGLVIKMDSFLIKVIFYISVFQLTITTLYIFNAIATFHGSVTQYIISSFLIANKHLWTTILILSSLLGTVFLTFYVSSFLILIAWGFYFMSTSYSTKKIFETYKIKLGRGIGDI